MNIELNAFDLEAFGAAGVKMIAVRFKFPQLPSSCRKSTPKIQQGPEGHVAADSAEEVKVKCFHG